MADSLVPSDEAQSAPNAEPSTASVAATSELERIRAEFEAAWKSGERPPLEQHLAQATSCDRSRLLAELLRIELAYRGSQNDCPRLEEYLSRFPNQADTVRIVFGEAPTAPAGRPSGRRTSSPGDPAAGDAATSDASIELDPTLCFTIMRQPRSEYSTVAAPPGLTTPLGTTHHTALQDTFAPGVAVQNRYVIEREIGRGGMGQVYLARDTRLARPVALKVCRLFTEREGDSARLLTDAEASFTEEAQLGANLSHPAIATVYDFGIHGGLPFTVFEYLEGESLRSRMRSQPRMPPNAVHSLRCDRDVSDCYSRS